MGNCASEKVCHDEHLTKEACVCVHVCVCVCVCVYQAFILLSAPRPLRATPRLHYHIFIFSSFPLTFTSHYISLCLSAALFLLTL